MGSGTVSGFLPSTSGFRFGNSFPRLPLGRIGVPGVFSLGIGDASNGLCGGMAFAARDYFEANRAPPPAHTAPNEGPLFDYLVDRLFDSFELPLGPIRYLQLMNPMLRDGETPGVASDSRHMAAFGGRGCSSGRGSVRTSTLVIRVRSGSSG